MKKLLTTAAVSAMLISTSFANLEGTIQGDIMLTNMPLTYNVPVLDGATDTIQADIMPISAPIIDDTLSITPISAEITKKFYRDGKTPKVYKSLEELLKAEKNVTSVTDGCNNGFVMPDGNAAMTMMYCEEVYGENGSEAWSRTDTLLPIYGENTSYFNEALFQKLDGHKSLKSQLSTTLSKKSQKSLEKALENADKLIETTKLSRIAKFAQDDRITKLFFIKTMIQDNLSGR